jgi:hypothetical protein
VAGKIIKSKKKEQWYTKSFTDAVYARGDQIELKIAPATDKDKKDA